MWIKRALLLISYCLTVKALLACVLFMCVSNDTKLVHVELWTLAALVILSVVVRTSAIFELVCDPTC